MILKYIVLFFLIVSCDSSTTVRDPGEKGKATVEGIDADNNGVRDDVQVWIEKNFADNEELKAAVMDMAQVHPSSCDFKHKSTCLELLVGFEQSFGIELELMERLINTPDRQRDFEERLEQCPLTDEIASSKCNSAR